LTTFSRPDQVGWWLRIGRRSFDKSPPIKSLEKYTKLWICWWTSLQPDWRKTGRWPLPCRVPVHGGWDELLAGGKDGLFIVVMTLAWWSNAQAEMEGESHQLEAAIADVSWV
ncbi:hypothetical protein BJ322DRAFT_986375, partial [Thelephora terrestris]